MKLMSTAYFIIFLYFCGEKNHSRPYFFRNYRFFTISIIKIFTRGVNMSFGGVPQWFFILAVAFAICFILYAEWNSRK